MFGNFRLAPALAVGLVGVVCSAAFAQRVQFSQPAPTTAYQGATTITPTPQYAPPPTTFDPYSSGGAAAAPSFMGPPVIDPFLGGGPMVDPVTGLPGGTAFPSQQPAVLFPQGIGTPFVLPGVGSSPYLKTFQNLRIQHTYLYGEDFTPLTVIDRNFDGVIDLLDTGLAVGGAALTDADLQAEIDANPDFGRNLRINDTEVGVTMTLPSFMYSEAPLLVAPGFIFHNWSGMQPILPSKAYSAFVDFAWNPHSRFAPQVSYELGLRLGIFSDFKFVNQNSFRHQGAALIVLRVTPTVAVKAGVVYLDRNDIKILPAGGLVWTPNERTRFDLVFPNPKLSQYFATLGNTTVWWYLKGEYGGDNWTVELPSGSQDRVDINDIRLIAGFEWTYPMGARGFFEAGYVFNREVVSARLARTIEQDDTFMLRGGLSF